MIAKKFTTALLASCLFSSTAFASWTLDAEKSRRNFVSIKKDSIGELHSFKQLSGKIGPCILTGAELFRHVYLFNLRAFIMQKKYFIFFSGT